MIVKDKFLFYDYKTKAVSQEIMLYFKTLAVYNIKPL